MADSFTPSGSLQQRYSDAWSTSTKRNSIPIGAFNFKDTSDQDIEQACTVDEDNLSLKATTTIKSLPTDSIPEIAMTTDVEAKGQYTAPAPEMWKPTKNEWLIMISLAFISLMVALDASILVTVLPEIAHKLNGTSVEAFWAGTSYLLTSAIFQPVIASISNTFGRQQLLVLSLVFFTIGTILCSVSRHFTMLLTGRCVQGVGGGGIITLTQVIFCDIVPLRQRPKYFPMVLGSWSVGSILGPVVGGVLTEQASWRWCFHINYPFCGIGLFVAVFFVRMNRVAELTFLQKLKETDWVGAFIFVGGMTSFLVGISWGGIQHPWSSSATLLPIVVGVFALLVFGWWQRRAAPKSLLPMSIFYNWSAIAALYCSLVNGLILFTTLYYVPFYFMSVRGKSSTDAGIDALPALCLLIPGSIIVSILTSRLGRFRWAIWGGWSVTTLTCGLLLLFGTSTSMVVVYVILAVFGIGTGMVLTSVNVGIQAISRPEDCAMAASMYGFFRSLGMPIGVALAGSIFQNAMSGRLAVYGLPADIAHDSERWVYVLRTMANGAKKTAILGAYMDGFHTVFIMMTGVAGSALLVSLVIQKFSMDQVLLTQFTAR
ncbi:major facilitator superfamily domain-containing protein [Ampelomyces quisqualis]|uniref:Major facilitator superfamily domain-containing protein n=1 Tax=Ampelomyces quisqualis TaxID=50730 RepID=A0A6A5QDC5_AMPQU|nr:major facilitator superfamily domain-containing protein [Ampelomyces quisqualis]